MRRHYREWHVRPEPGRPEPTPAPLPLAPDAPFPTWRRRAAEDVAESVKELGIDPYAALAFELAHDRRPGLVAALEELCA